MLLTIKTTHKPATDLGFLLHKHPDRFQSVKLSMGQAHVFYPQATTEETTIALLLDIDPIDMVRTNKQLSGKNFNLGQYVNDRPYVASSFMSNAIAKAFSTALNGKCTGKPELVTVKMPFVIKISVLPAKKGGERLIRELFEPLGYQIKIDRHILDEKFTDWGYSKYFTVELSNQVTTQQLLSHLYVLIPVLDYDKHYYINEDEINKLLKKGEGWLADHPHKEKITNRYLINLRSLSREALRRLNDRAETEEGETNPQEKKTSRIFEQAKAQSCIGGYCQRISQDCN